MINNLLATKVRLILEVCRYDLSFILNSIIYGLTTCLGEWGCTKYLSLVLIYLNELNIPNVHHVYSVECMSKIKSIPAIILRAVQPLATKHVPNTYTLSQLRVSSFTCPHATVSM